MTLALCAFLLAQRPQLARSVERNWMLVAYAAAAAATLTKGLVALVDSRRGARALYARHPRYRAVAALHALPGLAVYLALDRALVRARVARESGVRAVLLRARALRALPHRDAQPRRRVVVLRAVVRARPHAVDPGVGGDAAHGAGATRRACANGFSWERFCLVWAAFIFVFFSMSGSKLPSYILPHVPGAGAGARVRAHAPVGADADVDRAAARDRRRRCSSPLRRRLGRPRRRAGQRAARRPRSIAPSGRGCSRRSSATPRAASAAFALFRTGTARGQDLGHRGARAVARSSACSSRSSATTRSRVVRSAAPILARRGARERPAARSRATRCTRSASYDQTLPFYLGRPTPLVDFRDEMALGLAAEPRQGLQRCRRWIEAWSAAPQGYALMSHATAAELAQRERAVPRARARSAPRVRRPPMSLDMTWPPSPSSSPACS